MSQAAKATDRGYLTDDEVIHAALYILQHRFKLKRTTLNSPRSVRDYLQLTLAEREHEIFACIYLDAQHRCIALEELFRGTLTQTSVYPREVLKRALHHNAAAIILAHNHPSGMIEPSRADELLTANLKHALDFIDVKVLDHIVIAGAESYSFAEKGKL